MWEEWLNMVSELCTEPGFRQGCNGFARYSNTVYDASVSVPDEACPEMG